MENLAENLSDQEIIPKEDLVKYKKLNDDIKKKTNEKDLLNKRIKAKLGDLVLTNLHQLIHPHSDLVDRYLNAVAEVSVAKMSGTNSKEAEDHLKAVYAELQLVGISKDMIEDYVSADRLKALSHNKLDLNIEGFKVSTVIQDRSNLNLDKEIAFLKRVGMDQLLTTKVVVDEAALELAVLNGEIDAAEFKEACIDEKLVVSLLVK